MASVPDLNGVRANLAFACAHEADRLPPLDAQADSLFAYGRYLSKRDGAKDFNEIARYYRIAAAHGHYKANHSLQLLISQGLTDSLDRASEVLGLAEQLIKDGVPGGYYDIGHYLEIGYGLKQDAEMSLRYFRKAADLGNPDAQYYVAQLLAPRDKAPAIAEQMYTCAANQGHGEAAVTLGITLQVVDGRYEEAVHLFQSGVKAGNKMSAAALEDGFEAPTPDDKPYYLSLALDSERARRYRMIKEFLSTHESRNPKVPDIDKIVPLPPAKLPPWDGTFEWQKQQDAAVLLQKPSEELIELLAKEKHLDPATGLPLSEQQKSAAVPKVPLDTTVRVLEACPQAGVWQACPPSGYVATPAERTFRRGEKLPLIDVEKPRAIALLDDMLGARRTHTDGMWRLIAYSEES
ncbi:Sel1 domain protein repeat-containing protein [Burkholderia sp. YI23]|nr:Sel1 domain protein repeat-containing protein [Burkholderia sp. YI23]